MLCGFAATDRECDPMRECNKSRGSHGEREVAVETTADQIPKKWTCDGLVGCVVKQERIGIQLSDSSCYEPVLERLVD
jgi:hypothetical protein